MASELDITLARTSEKFSSRSLPLGHGAHTILIGQSNSSIAAESISTSSVTPKPGSIEKRTYGTLEILHACTFDLNRPASCAPECF